MLTTIEVAVDGDRATARSTWLLVGGDGLRPALLRYGVYDDRLRRSGGVWRLASRAITFGAA